VKTLVFVEHHGTNLDRSALGVLSHAARLGSETGAVLAGAPPLGALAAEVSRYGASTVFLAEDGTLGAPLPQPRIDVIDQIVADGGFDTVLFSNTVLAADVAAGLAARLDAGLNWDLVDIDLRDGALVAKQPALQDSVLVDVGWRSPHRIGLFRPGAFEAVPVDGPGGQVETVTPRIQAHSQGVAIVELQREEGSGPSLEDAEVIVAGGMGLGAPEHFSLAEELAAALGGVVGATRAAVYAGWYPRGAQVGQTGTTVSPKLYIALGISGAVQHKVGMQSSKVIVAVNKDPNAPIVEFSDLAVAGDVLVVVPKLIELVRQRRGT
jgi:electron transfer flavoprotein alpha subunit